MKKLFYLSLAAVPFAGMLSGCVNINMEEAPPKKDVVIQDLPMAEDDETTDVMEQFDYYCYSSGSSSVSEKYILYAYDEEIIFVADYFNCGNGLAETYALSDEQVNALKEQLEQGLADITRTDDRNESQGPVTELPAEGATSTSASICLNGQNMSAKKLDLEALGVELQSASEVEFPDNTNYSYSIEGLDELQKSDVWQNSPFFIGAYEYERMVGGQVEKMLGQQADTMLVGEMGEQDYELEVITKDGKHHILTVTYWGYVIKTPQT